MRQRVILLVCVFLTAFSVKAGAIMANKTPFTYTQPDGTVITLVMHGDEFCHWTTCNGKTVKLCEDGFYREERGIAVKAARAKAAAMREQTNQRRVAAAQSRLPAGRQRYLVVLVEFADKSFTVQNPQQAFSDLLNLKGYSANGGTGSAGEYFADNSMGKFTPEFDVVGPYKVSRNMAYYGGNTGSGDAASDKNPDEAFYEACRLADADVDFSVYDHDKDGYVDDVFFYYAGVNEAEGGGDDTIWPHAWALINYKCVCDGVRVYNYACGSEYRGSRPGSMCGIGTFCHEFGHTIGLPDFYDTDYEENGNAKAMEEYSLMSSGCYNNNGRTPPFFCSEERMMLGWMDGQTEWKESGSLTAQAIWTNAAYKTPTQNEGEYYTYETRGGSSWDKYVNKCLLVCRVDKSSRMVHGYTAAQRWASRYDINCYSDHPCYYVYRRLGDGSSFAAPDNNDWDGFPTGYDIHDVKRNGDVTNLTLKVDASKKIQGVVTSRTQGVIGGATVCVVPHSSSEASRIQSASRRTIGSRTLVQIARAAQSVVTTGSDGKYQVNLGETSVDVYDIYVFCEGHCSQEVSLTLKKGFNRQDFTLSENFMGKGGNILRKYTLSGDSVGFGDSPSSIMAGVLYSSSELKAYVGRRIESMTFQFFGSRADKVIAVVDFGNERVATVPVGNPRFGGFTVVDLSALNLVIPSGKTLTFGYGLKNVDSGYPVAVGYESAGSGALMYADYDEKRSSWTDAGAYSTTAFLTLEESAMSFSEYDITTIAVDGQVSAGSEVSLKLNLAGATPKSIDWYLDGQKCSDTTIKPASGEHVIKAVLSHQDGTREIVKTRIKVQ